MHIWYIEAETKFDSKDEGNHATISKIEGKLKSGKCTIESKIEGKRKSENYMTTKKFLKKSIISSKFSGREWLGHDGSEQRKTSPHRLLTRSKGVLEKKEKTLLKSRDIKSTDHENKDSFQSRFICKAKHELTKQFLIGSKEAEKYVTIKQFEEDRSEGGYKNEELLAEEFARAFIRKAKSDKGRQNKDLLAEDFAEEFKKVQLNLDGSQLENKKNFEDEQDSFESRVICDTEHENISSSVLKRSRHQKSMFVLRNIWEFNRKIASLQKKIILLVLFLHRIRRSLREIVLL